MTRYVPQLDHRDREIDWYRIVDTQTGETVHGALFAGINCCRLSCNEMNRELDQQDDQSEKEQ